MLDAGPTDADRPRSPSSSLIRREIVLLVVLCVVAVMLFGITQTLASWSRATMVQTAAEAHARGLEAEAAGDLATAVEEFRRAVFNDRATAEYSLHLAATLTEVEGGTEEAERLLLRLRETTPDDSQINYRLARLAARRGDVATAMRFYNHAMYGLMAAGADLDRREIRTELIGVLLDHGDQEGAVAELAALGRELPDELDAHRTAGLLAMRAGEYATALDRFERASELDPKRADVRASAGAAALALFDFGAATAHLDAALQLGAGGDSVTNDLAVARLALGADPLGPGLASAERARRLATGLDWIADRLDACPVPAPEPVSSPDEAPGVATPAPDEGQAAAAFDPDVAALEALRERPQGELRDADVVARGVALIVRLHGSVSERCPDASPIGHAWRLIGQAHPGDGA